MTDQEQDATETDEAGAVEPAEPDQPQDETEAGDQDAGDGPDDDGGER